MSVLRSLRTALGDLVDRRSDFVRATIALALSRKQETQVSIAGLGPIVVRPRNSDFDTFRQVFRKLDYRIGVKPVEDRIAGAYAEILSSGKVPVIVDAGANVGAASRWFARQFPEAHIVAIEPEPDTARILRRNIEPLGHAKVIEAAVGGEHGFVALQDQGAAWAVQTVRGESGLPVVTIADAVASVPDGKLFIAKIDIEGFESDLFAGNTAWIDEAFALYIEPHDWMLPGQRTSRSFQSEMGKRDFEMFLRRENLIYVR